MNKKKIATLLLVGTLLLGGGALGAKAWFTSNAKTTSNLKVTMGTLQLKALNNDQWQVENKRVQDSTNKDIETEVTNQDDTNNFVNVRPGDEFVKTVNLKNVGTLKVRADLTKVVPEIDPIFNDKIEITAQVDGNDITTASTQTIDLEVGGTKPVIVKVRLVGENIGNEYQNTEANKVTHKQLQDFLNSDKTLVTISGTQVNAPKQ